MKKLLLSLLLCLPLLSFAQPQLPINEEGKIVYAGQGETAVGKAELYRKLRGYYKSRFKSINEKEDGVILGKAWQDILIGRGVQVEKRRLWYTVKVEVDEGRFRYIISDLMLQKYCVPGLLVSCKTQTMLIPVEDILYSSFRKDERGDDRPGYKQVEFQIHEIATALIEDTKMRVAL